MEKILIICIFVLLAEHTSCQEEPNIVGQKIIANFSLYMTDQVTTTLSPSSTTGTTTPIPTVTGSDMWSTTTDDNYTSTDTITNFVAADMEWLDYEEVVNDTPDVYAMQIVGDIPEATVQEVIDWLKTEFRNTSGFEQLELNSFHPTTTPASGTAYSEYKPILYGVTYDVVRLSNANAMCAADPDNADIVCLEEQLTAVMESILAHIDIFPGDFSVNESATNLAMEQEIAKFTQEALSDPCNTVDTKICSNENNTCYDKTGAIQCLHKCDVYTMDTNPLCATPDTSLDIIYLEGTCVLSAEGTPTCDCGTSPGDVMNNFYDGTYCVSSAFVVGMAAGLAGFIIVVLLGLAIGFGCKSSKQKKNKDHIEAYRDSPFDQPKEQLIDRDGDKLTTTAYNNRGYDGFVSPVPVANDPFPNFQANLSHIDPKIDYSIRRPSVRTNSDYNGGLSIGDGRV